MSYFDDASLVMIPSGYKTSKVYSVKPTDGTGDLTFTRSNDTATRVASNGLIERVRTNLFTYSQDWTNAVWTKSQVTATANTIANPIDGTVNAQTITESTSNSTHTFYQNPTLSNNVYTFSIYVKANGRSKVRVLISDFLSGDVSLYYDMSTNDPYAFTSSGSWTNGSYNVSVLSSGWYRFSVSGTKGAGSVVGAQIYLLNAAGSDTYTGDNTSGIYVYASQLETGDIATDYIATTSAAVSVGMLANVPRLDYLNSSCPRLLLEPQRTNLLTYSEQINNAAWLNAGGTTTANTAVSPSGFQDADTLTGVRYQATFASNTYTLSVFAKKVDGDNTFVLRFDAPATKVAVFNLNNGTIVSTDAGYTSTITAYGNGWYRCTFTSPASTTISNAVLVSASAGVSSTFVYGCSLEVGSYATSYIPTLGAAVTRGADAASKTGISSLIGQTEGTLFAEFVHNGADILTTQQVMSVNSGNTQNFVNIGVYDGQLNPAARASSVDIFDLYVGPNPLPAGTHKIALAYKSGDFKIYLNGSAVYTDTDAATFGTMGQFDLGTLLSFGVQLGEGIKQALLFKTRLSNADLAALTA